MILRISRVLTAAVLAIAVHAPVAAQNLTQINFNGVSVPQFMGSGTSNRTILAYRATVTGLTANTTYRFFNQIALAADIGTTNPGAGNVLFFDGTNYTYTTGASLTTAGNFGTFTTDGSGAYTGWFYTVNTGNSRFTAGNSVTPTIVIGDTAGTTLERRALNQSITVLSFAASGANTGSFLWGAANVSSPKPVAGEIVALYDNIGGTGRPISASVMENINESIAIASLLAAYVTNVDGQNRRWGMIIPNATPNGVRNVSLLSRTTGSVVAADTDADGTWASGTNTATAGTGTAGTLSLTASDAPLPVSLSEFSAE
jgi:VCBS repeat-containing protein